MPGVNVPYAVMAPVARLLATARAEIGYHEKASAADLDSKTGNPGNRNYNKYARDLDALGNIYNGRKQGADWCDVFVDAMYIVTFGVELAMRLLCQPYKGCGAGTKYSMGYYKAKGQFHTSGPQPGDQAFFGDATSVWHTGLVEKSEGGKVYIIEGNTGPDCTMVQRCVYPLSYKTILGYGRPDWNLVDAVHPQGRTGWAVYRGDTGLYCRTYPRTGTVVREYVYGETMTIIQELDGWGLAEGQGWVNLNYVSKSNPEEDDDMDQEKFNQMFEVAMQAYRTKLRDNDSSEFSELARAWGIEHGIIQGGGKLNNGETNYMWEDLQTREQGVVMMYRLAVALGLA